MLLTNGCSFVWGDELEGFDESPPSHGHLTFTAILAGHLGVPYMNLATCGGCNQKIFRDTVDWLSKEEKPSHVVVIWSAWQREEVAENHPKGYEQDIKIKRYQCMTQISPSRVNICKPELKDALDRYYDVHDTIRTGMIRTLTYMTALQTMCDAMDIKLVQGVFHERMWQNYLDFMKPRFRKSKEPWTEWMNHIQREMEGLHDRCRLGLGRYKDLFSLGKEQYQIKDHGHPDEDTQVHYADLLLHIFNTQFEIEDD